AVSVTGNNGFNKNVTFSHVNLPSGLTGSFSTNPVAAGSSTNSTVSGTVANGDYAYIIRGTGEGISTPQNLNASIKLTAGTQAVTLSSPANNATGVDVQPTLSWNADSNAVSYRVEIATDSAFSNIVANGSVSSGTNFRPSSKLSPNTKYYWRVRSDNSCGNTWSAVHSFTTANATDSAELANGVAKTSLTAEEGKTLEFYMNVPAGAKDLKFVMNGGSGDADLYVRFGSKPTTSDYDCRPYESGNAETCTISNIQAGTYYVMIRGYSAFSGVSLTASYTEGGGGNTGGTFSKSDLSGASGSWQHFTVEIPSGMSSFKIDMSGGSGDADLYVRKGAQPTTNQHNCAPYKDGNAESCSINNPGTDTWYISVNGYSAYSGVSISAEWKP
ncbi:MAG: pre-peptidase C-terminal domain-containing protein, partial [Kangiellaceae bacterium]|nr:pre-peptidase C-terminal domain-containing protein [Kangiellaceae bacterium]